MDQYINGVYYIVQGYRYELTVPNLIMAIVGLIYFSNNRNLLLLLGLGTLLIMGH